jgi:hypothetical protein
VRKLQLTVEDLVVDSFVTDAEAHGAGTVHGHWHPTRGCDTVNATCDGAYTCEGATCNGVDQTCALSCDTCDQYHCGTIQGYDCTNLLGCYSEECTLGC